MAHEVPPLPYDYNALEPYIDEETMHLHHEKHYNTYVINLNAALEKQPEADPGNVNELLASIDSVFRRTSAGRSGTRGGGHANHSFFWQIMVPSGRGRGGEPSGDLAEAIRWSFGSFESFKECFAAALGTVFGSGWCWLIVNPDRSLSIESTPNQNSPSWRGRHPYCWEHAYYLKYQYRCPEYVDAFWNVVKFSPSSPAKTGATAT